MLDIIWTNPAEHWVKNLIKPVVLILLYVRAERERQFALHLYACKEMPPYFPAAGHWNYARDGVTYVRMMRKSPPSLLDHFIKGELVIHLHKGYWSGIRSDRSIKSTYMKFSKKVLQDSLALLLIAGSRDLS